MNSQDIQNIQESYLAVYDDETRENLEFENWVNNLLDEGYDLSDYTWDEMAEIYIGEERAEGVKPYGGGKEVGDKMRAGYGIKITPKPPSGKKGDGSGYGEDKKFAKPDDKIEMPGTTVPAPKKGGYGRISPVIPYGIGANATKSRSANSRVRRLDPGAPTSQKLPPEDKKKPSKEIIRKPKPKNEEYDLYDVILSHLIDEGYADTYESAEAIMVNMSEDWRESIVEEVLDEGQKKYPEEKVENAGNRKVRTLRDPNISPEKRLKTAIQLDTIGKSFMSHLTNRPQPVPPKRRK